MRPFLALLLAMLALLAPCAASAHLTPNSEVQLDVGRAVVMADVIIPLGEYAVASGNPTDNGPASLERARRYLRQNVAVHGSDGQPWHLAVERAEFVQIAGPPDLHAILRLTPPAGQSARAMVIDWQAVLSAVPNHFALFVLRSDFASGKLDGREILGALQGARRTLVVDAGAPRLTRGFGAAFVLGMRHIAAGHDHLLFLIALLLPAPLYAACGRWAGARPWRATAWHLATIVSAFTVGHSLTLVGAAAFDWHLPARPIEMLIALSILVSAVHALRPLFPGRESAVAAGFGLVHGLAFATVVGHFGLDAAERALAILGFNLGVECVQLLVVLSILPALLLLLRTRWFRVLRIAGGWFALAAAAGWLVDRALDIANPFSRAVDAGLDHALWLIALLTAAGVLAHVGARRRGAGGTLHAEPLY